MRVEVFAKTYRPEYKDTMVWSGEMSCVPRTGDIIFPFDGWGGVEVQRVFWNLTDGTVEVGFDDRDGAYSREAAAHTMTNSPIHRKDG